MRRRRAPGGARDGGNLGRATGGFGDLGRRALARPRLTPPATGPNVAPPRPTTAASALPRPAPAMPVTSPRSRRSRTRVAAAALLVAATPPLARAQPRPAGPTSDGTGSIRGVVYDSLAARPLAGAIVQVVARDARTVGHSTTTDSTGAFHLDSLPPGAYLVGFSNPLLDVLEVEVTPREVAVAPGAPAAVSLAVPGLATMRAALCGADARGPRDSTGLLVGTVRNADAEGPVPGARVLLTWSELVLEAGKIRTERRRVPVPVRPSGSYVACDVPTDAAVAASADAPGRASGLVEVALGPGRFVRRDFVLGDSGATAAAPSGVAQLAGVVRDPNGRPLAGVRAQVLGAQAQAVTGPDGRFTLTGLPTGTRTVEVRAIGYVPSRATVDLVRGHPTSVQLAVAKVAPVIDRVTVYGTAEPAARWEKDFDQRRRAGFGRFFTAADVLRERPPHVTDLVRRAPGVRLDPGRRGYAVRMLDGKGGFCSPSVVLDGAPTPGGADELDLLVRPEEVAGVEVFRGAVGAPLEYGGLQNSGCGEVLIWTKR